MRLFARLMIATLLASAAWFPATTQETQAVYCYPGDPPDVYQACLAYNKGIGLQVNNQRQLQSIRNQIHSTTAEINAIDSMISSLQHQIAAQQALINKTQAAIDAISRQIRFGQVSLIELQAHVSVRDQILEQRLRYIDSHGSVNYIELVLTSNSINQLLNRLVGAQEVAASDRKLLTGLQQEHLQVGLATAALDQQRTQVQTLLMQQQATQADMQQNLKTEAAALIIEQQLAQSLSAQYAKVQAERKAIDAQVAKEYLAYAAAARAHGGGSGVFEWPLPACTFSCITQGFGCSTFYLEVYDPACPYPHKIHTGLDIAGPYGTPIVAADTGVVYLYPGSVGYGNLVVMIHGNGYETYYGHTAGYAPGLRTGMIVARGTTIAFEGSTGWSTGPHLHFEIRVNGVYKDPCIWLGC